MKFLSRNAPIAFVVGAAGFLGSHLCERLLEKGIQVVGVDDLSTGRLENLAESSRSRTFSFVNQKAALPLPVTFPRLDYAFFLLPPTLSEAEYSASLKSFLKTAQSFKARIVLLSSIDLYDSKIRGLGNLRRGEGETARFAAEKKENARVVRLAAVYGPRMGFGGEDPIVRLLLAACREELQKEITALDFSTRALFVDDAINLLIKTVMHGATAQKIYDGVGGPIKVSEIKQILLDPLWHESRGFTPTELPPWPTPNLLKTEKELAWKPRVTVIEALKKTLAYFRENPQWVIEEPPVLVSMQEEKKQLIAELYGKGEQSETTKPEKARSGRGGERFLGWKQDYTERVKIFCGTLVGVLLISYGLIYPVLSLGVGVYSAKMHLQNSAKAAGSGDFNRAEVEAKGAQNAVGEIRKTLSIFAPYGQIMPLKKERQSLNVLLNILDQSAQASSDLVLGAGSLAESFRVVTGEVDGDLKEVFAQSYLGFDSAEKDLSLVQSKLSDESLVQAWPGLIKDRVIALRGEAEGIKGMASGGKAAAFLIPQMIGTEGQKRYLILAADNTTLRPGGGLLTAYAEVTFSDGKLGEIKTGSVEDLDGNLTEQIKSPAEVQTDLGKPGWSLGDSNQESDFPTNARFAEWFYSKEKGEKVDGVIMLDLDGLASLLAGVGPVSLDSGHQTVDSANLKTALQASSGKGKFLSGLLKEVLNRLFFLSGQNWLALGGNLNQSLTGKHLLIYLNDPQLFPFLKNNNWAGILPSAEAEMAGERQEFLQIVESNLSAPGLNNNLGKAVQLEDGTDGGGIISHRLSVGYTNPGPQDYRFRLKIYLASGVKILKVGWGGEDLTAKISNFSDFGRAGYSMVLELQGGGEKSLTMEYQDIKPLEFRGGEAVYRLKVVKQAGTGDDKFDYNFSLPESLKAGGQTSASTNLSQDRFFEFSLKKVL